MGFTLKQALLAIVACLSLASQSMAATAESTRTAGTQGASSTEKVKIKSYREWKSERIQDALSRVTVTKTQLEIAKSKDPNLTHQKGTTEANAGVETERLVAQLKEDLSYLETVKRYGWPEYTAGHLMKVLKGQNKKATFNEVAGKLTADEIAELMSAYTTNVFGSSTSELAPSANNVDDRVR